MGASSSTPTASGSTYLVSWVWSGLACSRPPWPCSSRPPCATPSPTGRTLCVRSSWRFRRAWRPSWCTSPGTGTGTWPPSAWSSSCSSPPAPRTWRPGPPTVGGPGRQVRGAGGDEQEEDHADGGHVPVPVPGDVHHEGRHARLKRHEERTQRVLPVGEGVAHGGRDEQGHGGREQAKPDHTQLTKYVEPLAVGVLDAAPRFTETVVREDERAGAGAAQPVGPGLREALAPERRPAGVKGDEPAGPFAAAGVVGARDEGLHAVLDQGRAATAFEEAPRATADAGHQHHQHRGSGGDAHPAWPRHGALHERDHSLRSRGDEQRRQRPAQQGVALEGAQSIIRGRAEEGAEVAQTPQHSRHGSRDGHQARETGETRRGEAEVQDQRQDEHDQAAARQGEEEREAERHRGGLVVLVLTLILYFGFTTTRLASFASLVAIA